MMDSSAVSRYKRDAGTNTLAEGASEMHYDFVACGLFYKLGLG